MPVTPLPASNTKRYFIVTLLPNGLHHTQIRVTDAIDNATALAGFQFDFNLLAPAMYSEASIVGLEVAEHGSDIRNPVSGWATIPGTGGSRSNLQFDARTFSARGRSVSGRKVKMLLWGLNVATQPDFELTPAVGPITTFMSQLTARNNAYLTIDGTTAVWRSNLLEDYNDHWEKEARPA